MLDATAPPKDEEVRYVGVWLDDHGADENYESDRWAPFVRCVITAVGGEEAFRRHPRPLFDGTSFANIWGAKFGRAHVEGLFVEVPLPLASRLLGALQTTLSVRGILLVDQAEFPQFFGHALATRAWLVGDVCVGDHWEPPEDEGIRVAHTGESDPDMHAYSRAEAEAFLEEIVRRGVTEPKGSVRQRSAARAPVETLIVRTEYDTWNDRQAVPADVALFDMEATPDDFEEQLVKTVAANIAKKDYKTEVVLWSWTGWSSHKRKTYFAAITTRAQISAYSLFKGLTPTYFEGGAGELSDRLARCSGGDRRRG